MAFILWCVFVAIVAGVLGRPKGIVFVMFASSATLMLWLLSIPLAYLGPSGSAVVFVVLGVLVVAKAAYDTRDRRNKATSLYDSTK